MDKRIKPINEVLALLGEHMEQLRPTNKPTMENILAAKTVGVVVNSYIQSVMLCMEHNKQVGGSEDFSFLQLKNGGVQK